jgi:CBS domain-containing protein
MERRIHGSMVMKVSDVMTPNVLSVPPDASVATAAQLMLQKRISGVPVIDDRGNLVGIISEGDFLRRAETGTGRRRPRWTEFFMGPGRLADEYVRLSGRKVRDVMTHEVHTVAPDAPLEQVVRLMERHNIKRLPSASSRAAVKDPIAFFIWLFPDGVAGIQPSNTHGLCKFVANSKNASLRVSNFWSPPAPRSADRLKGALPELTDLRVGWRIERAVMPNVCSGLGMRCADDV